MRTSMSGSRPPRREWCDCRTADTAARRGWGDASNAAGTAGRAAAAAGLTVWRPEWPAHVCGDGCGAGCGNQLVEFGDQLICVHFPPSRACQSGPIGPLIHIPLRHANDSPSTLLIRQWAALSTFS